MLFAQKVAFRFAVGTALPATRFSASLPYRLATSTNVALLSRGNVIVESQRSYATPGRPKKGSIEESSRKSRPRKTKVATSDESTEPKAVKAPKEKSTKSRAVKAPKEESAEAKAAREAKEAAKKATAEKKKQKDQERAARLAARKQKEKERAVLKKSREKARKEREAAKKTITKALSERRKAQLKKTQDAQELKELKEVALSPPRTPRRTSYNIFTGEVLKEKLKDKADNKDQKKALSESAEEWKQLTPVQLEHYNHLANQAIKTDKQQYSDYVQQYTPEQIRTANAARTKLRSRETTRKGQESKWKAIQDERQVSRPITPYTIFNVERFNSGDFKNIHFKEAAKLIGQEWNSLGESEKQKYMDENQRQREQYIKDYREVYGHEPTSSPRFHSDEAATSTE